MAPVRRPAVGIKIHAGLGNQMFMYAAALAMARRLDASLLCDTRYYVRRDRGDRGLGLDAFGIQLGNAWVPPHRPLRELASRLHLVADPFRHAERLKVEEGYDPAFHEIRGSCALEGYFQSWRYLVGYEDAVRQSFDVNRLATPRTQSIAAEIAGSECPVAVHIRRGDYATSPEAVSRFGLLYRDYYDEARQVIEATLPTFSKPTYFLFSDEPQAAVNELDGWTNLRPVAGYAALEELRLMTLCRHFIIANSTFSWWAAWLGHADDKRVVAPRRWFGDAYEHAYRIEDRLPPEWISV